MRGLDGENELPTVYIGQSDEVRARLDDHYKAKLFWSVGIAFVSTNTLNRGHTTWLEHALIKLATQAKQSLLDNGTVPAEPNLSESEKADTRGFLKEILQILPLVGFQAFEAAKVVAQPKTNSADKPASSAGEEIDTLIVPAQKDGFDQVFLGEKRWYAVRISAGMLPKLKYIAAYQVAPVSAITHLAPIDRIESFGDNGKYVLYFSEPAKAIGPIPLGDTKTGTMQGPRYGSLQRLQGAKKVADCLMKT